MILANGKSCDEIQKLFPGIPFDWKREGLGSLPLDWCWIGLVPQRVSKSNPPDLFEISLALLPAKSRVVLAEPDSYRFLHSESDIQYLRMNPY